MNTEDLMKVLTVTLLVGALGLFASTGQIAHATSHDQMRGPGTMRQGMISPGLFACERTFVVDSLR